MNWAGASGERYRHAMWVRNGRMVLRARDVTHAGASRFWTLCDFKRVGRGLYVRRRKDAPVIEAPFLLAVRHAGVTVCLASALQMHGLFPLSPEVLWLARRTSGSQPRGLPGVRVETVQFGPPWSELGVVTMHAWELTVRVTGIARTVADLLAFRARVGTDLAVQALEEVVRQRACCGFELERMLRARRVHAYARPLLKAARRRWPTPPVRAPDDFQRQLWLPFTAAPWEALPRNLTFPWTRRGQRWDIDERPWALRHHQRPCACRFLPPGQTLDGRPCDCGVHTQSRARRSASPA